MSQDNEFQDHKNSSPVEESPFSADLKNDFSDNFATGVSGVSQMFREGGFVGENRTRLLALVGLLVLIIAGALFYLFSDDDYKEDDFIVADEAETSLLPPAEQAELITQMPIPEAQKTNESMKDKTSEVKNTPVFKDSPFSGNLVREETNSLPPLSGTEEDSLSSSQKEREITKSRARSLPAASIAPSLTTPGEGMVRNYDETTEAPLFTWGGSPGGVVLISAQRSMQPAMIRRRVKGNSARIRRLLPGTWYWQVRNGAGSSEVRSFVIREPVARSLNLASPSAGATLDGNGGIVSWTGDQKISFYRVEMNQQESWTNPEHRFATSGTQLKIQGVSAGSYQLRLGAFSEVSGRWEYTNPVSVVVR
ncbi:MAG: hypothetical protein H6618_09655 [Deltaproteobacteria bacterium]|nr:hypothetical protein [Deltaproteobacteria bacterium]